jgi:hypothetical protein
VSRPAYPKDWPPIVKNPSIESFSGEYNIMLMEVLGQQEIKIPKKSKDCLFDFSITNDLELMYGLKCKQNDKLKIFPKVQIKLADTKIVVKQKEDEIVINYHYKFAKGQDIVGPSNTYVLLSKASDGSLIVKQGYWTVGLAMFLIPVAGTEYKWYRFSGAKVDVRKGKFSSGSF